LTVFKNEVLFNGLDAAGIRGLWVSDGTAASTHELTGIAGASTSGSGLNPTDFTVFNGEVLFDGVDAAGDYGLWVTDGTAAGTHELTGIKGAYSGGLAPSDFTVINTKVVLFDGVDSSGNHNLWATNGTVAGTHELNVTGASSTGLNLNDLTKVTISDPKHADAFHFATDLGSATNANSNVQVDAIETNVAVADLAALMTDTHQGGANALMAFDGHETTTGLDQVAQSHLHAANVHSL
jgi:ELWxxDGT repeat protein